MTSSGPARPSTAVLRDFRERLAMYREAGVAFDDAWTCAMALVDDDDWRAVLNKTSRLWERAYDGRPAARREDAVGRIALEALEHRAAVGERLVA